MIDRREFITLLGSAVAWPLAARSQQRAMPVIGYLGVRPNLSGLRAGLSEQGYELGRNALIEVRESEQYAAFPALAAELVRLPVAVIVTITNLNAAQAAKAATGKIPIVFTLGSDPVRTGLVASLSRPGRNLTGVSYFTTEVEPKRLGLLREVAPQSSTIAYLVNPDNAATELNLQDLRAAAQRVGQGLMILAAHTGDEIDAAFATLVRQRAGGVVVEGDSFFFQRREQIVALAARHAMPAIYSVRAFTDAGGLMSYSSDRFEAERQAGNYVGRILKGDRPADLPVQQPTKFELAINLKAAKALGLTFPLPLLALADELIE
jgi:putative ABC transport system substrate-binding protein